MSTINMARVLAADTAGQQFHKAHEYANYVLAGELQAGKHGSTICGFQAGRNPCKGS
jgi:hypothetical protein